MNKEEYLKSQKYEISQLTCLFHDTYEDFAKEYGYETRNDTKVFDMESPNGKTMYKTVEKIMTPYLDKIERLNKEIKELKDGWQEEVYSKNEVLNDWYECERKINILHSIIKEVRELIKELKDTQMFRKNDLKEVQTNIDIVLEQYDDILEILDKAGDER